MKALSFGDKLAVLSQHVFHFHFDVLDDNKKKILKEILVWCIRLLLEVNRKL